MKSMKRNSRLKKLKACKNNLIRLHMSIIAWGGCCIGNGERRVAIFLLCVGTWIYTHLFLMERI